MMRSKALIAAMLVASGQTVASAQETVPVVSATLDYQKPDEAAYESFFAAVQSHDGKAIRLKLVIIPKQPEEEQGFDLREDAVNSAPVTCGRDHEMGIIDNLKKGYTLSFQHPVHYHAAFHAYIGDRTRYAFNSLVCGVEGYTTLDRTPLLVDGYFVVTAYQIPTQDNIALVPYDPR